MLQAGSGVKTLFLSLPLTNQPELLFQDRVDLQKILQKWILVFHVSKVSSFLILKVLPGSQEVSRVTYRMSQCKHCFLQDLNVQHFWRLVNWPVHISKSTYLDLHLGLNCPHPCAQQTGCLWKRWQSVELNTCLVAITSLQSCFKHPSRLCP